MLGVITKQIIQKLEENLQPLHLEVVNESQMHNVPSGSESHFKVVAAAQIFEGKSAVARHQQVYAILAQELAGSVHALALHLYSPHEWETQQSALRQSPACLGGSKA